MKSVRWRSLLEVGVAFFVAWLGGKILGEYPFTGWLPILGGFLLGLTVIGAAALIERGDPAKWVIVLGAAFAAWGEWRAAWIDAGGIGPLTWQAYAAIAAASAGALGRLIPPRRDWHRESHREPDADGTA